MRIGSREVGENQPTYFIADIAANHDGALDKALELITLAAEAGADAAVGHLRHPDDGHPRRRQRDERPARPPQDAGQAARVPVPVHAQLRAHVRRVWHGVLQRRGRRLLVHARRLVPAVQPAPG